MCLNVMTEYCLTDDGAVDEECIARGLVPHHPLDVSINACPWSLIEKACATGVSEGVSGPGFYLGEAEDLCTLMIMTGAIQKQPLASTKSVEELKELLVARATSDAATFVAGRGAGEIARRNYVARRSLYHELFDYADANGDGFLAQDEVYDVLALVRALRQGGGGGLAAARDFLLAMDDDTVINSAITPDSSAGGDGSAISKDEFFARLEQAYEDAME